MELPTDVLMYIKEFSRPISRPDWRKGCAFNRGTHHSDHFVDFIEYSYYMMASPESLNANGYNEDHIIHMWDDVIPGLGPVPTDDDDDDDDE